MAKVESPFLIVNPKSYLYGEKSLELAKAADKTAKETGLQIYFTCPYADIRLIKENTENLIVCAQSMDSLTPGRGMGYVLPESLKEAGAGAVFLNHAENQKTVSELYATIKRAKELGMITIVCADSTVEAKAVACMDPDIVLAEPTDLIGTGQVADDSYTIETVKDLHESESRCFSYDRIRSQHCRRLLQRCKTWSRRNRSNFRNLKRTITSTACTGNGRGYC